MCAFSLCLHVGIHCIQYIGNIFMYKFFGSRVFLIWFNIHFRSFRLHEGMRQKWICVRLFYASVMDRILKLFSFFAFYLNKIIAFQCGITMGIFLHQFVFSVRYLSVSWSVSEPMWPSLHFLRSVECQMGQILRVCVFMIQHAFA